MIRRDSGDQEDDAVNRSSSSAIAKVANMTDDPSKIFEILEKIGEGSFGVVYRAKDLRDGEIVALKIVPIDGAGVEDLVREIGILQNCADSPYIVKYGGCWYKNHEIWVKF
jgi:serine/threonine-protein kinase 24/25/MST4